MHYQPTMSMNNDSIQAQISHQAAVLWRRRTKASKLYVEATKTSKLKECGVENLGIKTGNNVCVAFGQDVLE